MPAPIRENISFSTMPKLALNQDKGMNFPLICATLLLGYYFLTHMTSFVPIAIGAVIVGFLYDKKPKKRWLFMGLTAFIAVIGYFMLESVPAHAFFLNNAEQFARDTFVSTGASNTQVNAALTIAFGLIRVVALGLVFGGVWQGYNNFRGGQELSSIVMPPASAIGLIVVTQAISNMMLTNVT